MTAVTIAAISAMHRDIEMTTRRLELEKRRLQRLERELASARQSYEEKIAPPERCAPLVDGSKIVKPPSAPRTGRPSHSAGRRTPRAGRPRAQSAGCSGEGSMAPEDVLPCKALARKLEAETKKLDALRHGNESLRTQIDATRRQRLQLNGIFERLCGEIKQQSEQLAESVEEAEASRGVCQEAAARVLVVKREQEAKREAFKGQVIRLRREMAITDHERKEIEVQLKRASEGVQQKKGLVISKEEERFSESCIMRRIMKTAFLNSIQRRHIKRHHRNIEVFEQAFATIKESTGISDIEEIVRIFVELENRNFSLLNYVNHMNREIEVLEGARRWREETEQIRRAKEARSEEQREAGLSDLRKRLQKTTERVEGEKYFCEEQHEILEQIKPSILRMTDRLTKELEDMRIASGTLPFDELPKLPLQLRPQDLPAWLQWVELALRKLRDILPNNGEPEQVFPATAAATIRQLAPKRRQVAQLVRPQELPSPLAAGEEQAGASAQKRLTADRKPELHDDDSDEEDFDRTPLLLRDLRFRAQLSSAKKRRRGNVFRHALDLGTATTATPSRGPSRAAALSPGPGSPRSEDTTNKRASQLSCADVDSPDSEGGEQEASIPSRILASIKAQAVSASEQEIESLFLSKHSMSRPELDLTALKMGIELGGLCHLKRHFDAYDHDRTGRVASGRLEGLLLQLLGVQLQKRKLEEASRSLLGREVSLGFFELCSWLADGK